MENLKTKEQQNRRSLLITILLLLSFFWLNLYASINSIYNLTSGNIFNTNSTAFEMMLSNLISISLFSWISFEIIFYVYRLVLSFKVYSFLVPQQEFKIESKIYFIYRNLILGIFTNICFLFPFLYQFESLISLIVTMGVMVVFSLHLSKKYSESIISHFVFKCFCYPVYIYEAIALIFAFVEVL